MKTVFSSDGVTGARLADRVAALTGALNRDFVGLQVRPKVGGSLSDYTAGTFQIRQLDGVSIARFNFSPLTVYRTRHEIQRNPRDEYLLTLHLRGAATIAQDGRRTTLAPGDLVISDAARPYGVDLGGETPFEQVVMRLPRARLAAGRSLPEHATAIKVGASSEAGQLLSPYFATLASPDWRETALASRFVNTGIELFGAVIEDLSASRTPSARTVLLRRVLRETQSRLSDPDLSPAEVARACCVSVRQLHRLFSDHGTTYGTWVREHRLAGSHRDLMDAGLGYLPIADIAARWGFRSAAHYSRNFRDRYGVPPSDVRRGVSSTSGSDSLHRSR